MTAGNCLGKIGLSRLAALPLLLAVLFMLSAFGAACSASLPAQQARETAVSEPPAALGISAPPPVRANRPVRFEQISITEGLSESVVRAVLQDRDGFLWFATDDGLNRFDGYDFVVYKNDPEDPGSLSHSQISRLLEDRQGRLWVGTFSAGLNRFDRETGRFTRYR